VEEIDDARYAITDLLDDMAGPDGEVLVTCIELCRAAAELLLGANGRWSGSGKWLLRQVHAFDRSRGSTHGETLMQGLHAAADGDTDPMRCAVEEKLEPLGGRLFDGYRRGSTP
jgi:hypothetical protein